MSGNPNFWKKYHKENSTYLFTSKIQNIIEKLKINSILEIGCGIGDNLKKIERKRVVGIDISEFAIKKAREKYPKFEFHVGNVLQIPLEEKFDLVFSCAVIEHIKPNLRIQAFNEMYRMSNKYILNIEAYDETEHEINWHRGKNEFWTIHMAKRWSSFPVKILDDLDINDEYRMTLISKI
jgi:ubiquinone/menaquinone biosynthesis C-methylase UbiE